MFACFSTGREGVLDISEKRTEGGFGLEHRSDVEVPTHPPDLFTNGSYVREVDSGWPLLLPFPPSLVVVGFSLHLQVAKKSGCLLLNYI